MGEFRDVIERSILAEIGKGNQDIWESSVTYLNSLGWQLSWENIDNEKWHLYSQGNPIFIAHKWFAVQSFIYGVVRSTLSASLRLKSQPRPLKHTRVIKDKASLQESRSLAEVFDEWVFVNEHIFTFEKSFTAFGRATSMYKVFQKKQHDPKYTQHFEEFATFYEKKLALETTLKFLSEESVNRLKYAARRLESVPIKHSNQLPVALAFIFLHLEQTNSSWYHSKGKWYYFEGDQLTFSAEDRNDFEGFILGMAYNYAKLSDRILEQHIKDPLRHRRIS